MYLCVILLTKINILSPINNMVGLKKQVMPLLTQSV